MKEESKPHSREDVWTALSNLESDLGNLDPAVHGEDLAAASGYAKDDLRIVREYLDGLVEQVEAGVQSWAHESRKRVEAEMERDELKEQYEDLRERYNEHVAGHDFVRGSDYRELKEQLHAAEKQRDACMEMARAERPPDAVFNKALQDENTRLLEQLEQLEAAKKILAEKLGIYLTDEDFLSSLEGDSNPASEPKED